MPISFNTPTKAHLKGFLHFAHLLEKNEGRVYTDGQLAKMYGCHRNTVNRIRHDRDLRTSPSIYGENRGRKRKLGPEETGKIIQMYDEYPNEAPDLPWTAQLANACDVEATDNTIRSAMKQLGYGKFVADTEEYMTPKKCEVRVSECQQRLEELDQEDFLKIRYSDESHFGWKQRSMGRQYISRKRGERYEPKNIRERPAPDEGDDHKVHVWGAVGLGFKSELVRYQTTNQNGKMSRRVYLDQILDPVVKTWLDEGHDFILEEDNDSGHRGGIVTAWKEDNGLRYFFNPPYSPDLSPIENCWRKPDQYVYTNARFSETSDELFDRAKEGWEELNQDTIDEWVRSVRQRYKDVIELGGKMIGRTMPKDDDNDVEEDQDQYER